MKLEPLIGDKVGLLGDFLLKLFGVEVGDELVEGGGHECKLRLEWKVSLNYYYWFWVNR